MKRSQPYLPVREPPKQLEYEPAEGAPPWLICDWQGLSAAFGLAPKEATPWHVALAGQGRPWLVIRRIFQVAPMFGDGSTTDDMRPWKWEELSESLGVPVPALKADLAAAVDFWHKAKLAGKLKHSGTGVSPVSSNHSETAHPPGASEDTGGTPVPHPTVKPLDPSRAHEPTPDQLPAFQIHQELTDAQITGILTPFRFQGIKGESDRLYVANRILELRKLLEDKHMREAARQLVVMELNLAAYEASHLALKARLDAISQGTISEDRADEVRKLAEAVEKTEKAITQLATRHRQAAADLGEGEIEDAEQQRVAMETMSYLTEAHRQYYATGERALIDGVFPADEVLWLTQPLTIRPAQYRADVVVRVREAMQPENLWGPDYKPTVIQREACRRLARLAQSLAEETEPEPIPEIDADTSGGEPLDDDGDALPSLPPLTSQAVSPHEPSPPPPREEEPFMAM